MNIKDLIKIIGLGKTRDFSALAKLENFEIKGISCNSKEVKKDFVFVAIKGVREDGNMFIDEAIDRGAKAVIVSSSVVRRPSSVKIPFIKVKDTRKALAKLASVFSGNPSLKLKVVGVTGTNGKTTITYLIEALLSEARFSPSVIGTINCRFNGKVFSSKNTTPGPLELQSLLARTLKENVDYAIMEASSHALDQDRTGGINFHSAIFTNLTQDHLDYHKTMDNYFSAKAKLFKNIDSSSFVVINNDDAYGRKIPALTRAGVITYGIKNSAHVRARDIRFSPSRVEFMLECSKGKIKISSSLIGMHNVYNILAAAAWGINEGIDLSTIEGAIAKFSSVPGRLERINARKGFSIFVDYAHTEDALRNVIGALRQVLEGSGSASFGVKKKIIVVFGCGGERDKTKRPLMGRVVSELSDFAIICNDNPRSEFPLEIIEDIKRGISKDNYSVIPDRLEAIRKSLFMAKPGDIVLVAGKGHENYQVLNDKTIHFDDREAIRECLKSMN